MRCFEIRDEFEVVLFIFLLGWCQGKVLCQTSVCLEHTNRHFSFRQNAAAPVTSHLRAFCDLGCKRARFPVSTSWDPPPPQQIEKVRGRKTCTTEKS